jgi:hypothetical protein
MIVIDGGRGWEGGGGWVREVAREGFDSLELAGYVILLGDTLYLFWVLEEMGLYMHVCMCDIEVGVERGFRPSE